MLRNIVTCLCCLYSLMGATTCTEHLYWAQAQPLVLDTANTSHLFYYYHILHIVKYIMTKSI